MNDSLFEKYPYVCALAREGSFTRAAQSLFISQPSLSVAIRNLEKRIGAELFHRTGSGVALTEAGREYLVAAEKIIAAEKEFRNKIHDIQNLESGEITVGGSNYLSSYVLPQVISAFTRLHPKIRVNLAEANSITLLSLLKEEKVDLILDNLSTPEDYVGYPLAEETILLCVPAGAEIPAGLEKDALSPDDIFKKRIDLGKIPAVSIKPFQKERFILLKPGNDMHQRAAQIFRDGKVEPDVAFFVDQLNISYALVDSGNGLSFVTDTFFKYGRFRENVRLFKMGDAYRRTLYLAHKKDKYASLAMKEFIRVAKEVIR